MSSLQDSMGMYFCNLGRENFQFLFAFRSFSSHHRELIIDSSTWKLQEGNFQTKTSKRPNAYVYGFQRMVQNVSPLQILQNLDGKITARQFSVSSRHIQGLDNIESANYVLSVCGIETLVELSSLGKSGKLLYLSHDDRFVVKTIRKTEKKALLAMLPKYVDHIQTFGSTLLTKFYGLHVVRPVGGKKIYFVVMGNILQTDLYLHRRFDLKGSSQGRSMNKVTIDEATTFKDHDLNLTFFLNPLTRHRLFTQIKKDCKFLEEAGIMGYSLLLGIHIEAPIRGSTNGRSLTTGNSFPPDSSWRQGSTELILDYSEKLTYKSDAKLGFKTQAGAVPKNEVGSAAQSFNNVRLFFGIIDMLQGYNVVKRLEHAYKAFQFDSRKITSVNPKVYSSRFQEYLSSVFEADEMKFRGSFN